MSDFKTKMHQIRLRLGLRPRPRWGSLQRSLRLPSCNALLLRGGKGEGEGRGGIGGEGWEGKRGEREGMSSPNSLILLWPLPHIIHYTGWTWKVPLRLWLLLIISAMHADFCMKFYTTVKQRNIHFTTEFCWIITENDIIMPFQPRQPPISQCCESSPVVWW